MQSMRRHSMDSVFFCLAEGRGRLFLFFPCSQTCFILFPWGSPSSEVVPHVFPNSTSALSHMVCPKSNSHVYKLEKVGDRRAYLFLFCYLGSKEVLLLGEECPMFQKKVVMGQSMCLLSNKKRKKKCGCTHERINMNHTHPQEQNGGPSLHDLSSHWLHGNSIPKIGCHYFWPRLSNSPS